MVRRPSRSASGNRGVVDAFELDPEALAVTRVPEAGERVADSGLPSKPAHLEHRDGVPRDHDSRDGPTTSQAIHPASELLEALVGARDHPSRVDEEAEIGARAHLEHPRDRV